MLQRMFRLNSKGNLKLYKNQFMTKEIKFKTWKNMLFKPKRTKKNQNKKYNFSNKNSEIAKQYRKVLKKPFKS